MDTLMTCRFICGHGEVSWVGLLVSCVCGGVVIGVLGVVVPFLLLSC